MYESISRKLQLVFFNELGLSNTISPKVFKETIDSEAIQSWMDRFSQLGLFYNADKKMALYTQKKSARIIETKTTEIFNTKVVEQEP